MSESEIESKKGPIVVENSTDGILTIDLYGIKFRFKPDNSVENPEQIIYKLNQYIFSAEEHIKRTESDRNRLAIILLAAMNLSDDFCKLKFQYDDFKSNMMKKTTLLLDKIDDSLCS